MSNSGSEMQSRKRKKGVVNVEQYKRNIVKQSRVSLKKEKIEDLKKALNAGRGCSYLTVVLSVLRSRITNFFCLAKEFDLVGIGLIMIKLAIVSAILGLATSMPYPHPLTQEQLAQFVAAQQTAAGGPAGQQQRLISIVPRARQAYQEPDPAAAYHKPSQAAYQPEPSYQEEASADAAYQQQPVYYQAAVRQQKPQQVAYIDPSQYKKYKLPRPSAAGLPRDPKQPADDYDPNPQYQFSFDIKDDESTNYHNRKETRDGDKISGSYSVVDSDGYIRTVTYTADPLEGFKADVSRQPTDIVVKLPKHPTPGIAQQYQLSPSQALTARKQQTQQYLEASSPVDEQQYVQPQQQQQQVYVPQRTSAALTQAALAAYAANPHRLAPVPAKSAKAYTIPQGATLLYRPAPSAAYQQ